MRHAAHQLGVTISLRELYAPRPNPTLVALDMT